MGKHKKIKAVDPFYYGNRKQFLNRNEKVVNQAPKNTDDQEVPRKLRELMQWKKQQDGKVGKSKRRAAQAVETKQLKGKNKKGGTLREGFSMKRVGPDEPQDGRPVEKVPVFTQKPWESEKRFVERMHMATQVAYEKAKWAPDIDPIKDEEKKTKKQNSKAKQHVNKKKEKLKAKRREKAEDQEEQSLFTDHIKFGEVVSQPPELTARPRKATANNKPGKKSLLLHSLMNPTSGAKNKTSSTTSSKMSRKRKNMSVAEKRMLDAERERVIQAYRTAKKAKFSTMSSPPTKKIIIGDV